MANNLEILEQAKLKIKKIMIIEEADKDQGNMLMKR